jgi:hypothetical protein
MAGMTIHYKPSQWRGKRVVYQSIDPAEPKRETIRFVVFIGVGVMALALAWFLSN